MDRNDQQAIENLFERLINAEQQLPQRDPEAENYIREQIRRHPGAPYYMAQTIIVQQQALEAARERIEQLQAGIDSSQTASDAQLSRTSSRQPTRSSGSVPRVVRSSTGAEQQSYPQVQAQPTGGGFLAGAAQTAIGVAGGFLLGNLITDMMGGGKKAEAAESQSDSERAEDADADSAGDDVGGFEDFDI
jgi:uncharacterized protein